jgi:flagellar basal-body rod protein FlgG
MSMYGMYTSGLAALGQSIKIDQIANNLANVATPGFRRDQISFKERLTQAIQNPSQFAYYNAQVDRNGGAPFIDQVTFDRQSGGYAQTQQPLDLAIVGQGFFGVRDLQTGSLYYTRAGNFTMAADGSILTADGRYQLLSEDGRGLTMDPSSGGELRRREDGTIFQGTNELGKVSVVDFDNYRRLHKIGDNLLENSGATGSSVPGVRVAQGSLEQSSVNPVSEMVEMIKANRALESNLQMIRIQDTMLDHAVNDLGRPAR